MNKVIEDLGAWGCDIKGALGRMLQDEEFYLECLQEIPGDPNFEELGKALAAHDPKKAFDAAHTLKGVLANLGLTPMYNQVVTIVEPLRAGSSEDLTEKYLALLQMRDRFIAILGN